MSKLDRRAMLGLAVGAAAMPKAAASIARDAFLPAYPSPANGYPQATGYTQNAMAQSARSLEPIYSLDSLMSAGEKLLMTQHRERVDEMHKAIERRREERERLRSMSDAAKIAYQRRDLRELQQAQSTFHKFIEQMETHHYKRER